MPGGKALMERGPKPTILVTGGTGFLGSHLVTRLLAEGHRVVVPARSRHGLSADQRMARLLDWFGTPHQQRSLLEVVEANLEYPSLGIAPQQAADLRLKVDEIIHCASDTSFSSRKEEQVKRVNIQGLEHLLDLLSGSRCRRLYLISTAYVAGKRIGDCPEAFQETTAFHNVYEQSKFIAEQIAASRCAASGIRLTVIRPSIVYGDAQTGRTLAFNALYYPVRTIHYFSKLYHEDILEHGGDRARALGIHRAPDGTLHLPIRIDGGSGCGVNLIPVDYFLRAFLAIRDAPSADGVFHIVNPQNTSIAELVDFTRRFFHLTGLEVTTGEDVASLPRHGLELLFDRHIQAYSAYIRDARIFDRSRSDALLRQAGVTCPAFTYAVFTTCMRFAVDVDWGRLLWESSPAGP
ncbi:SDR family oxidoreductase [Desulfobulbus alkaliphilus]|uniref:SDR family oxidoreductase n=1 Tax=Desulfobulbus alkaliphilus TaxID=869814 RepID=UPI001964D87E|nr:SDR family oxidoreductase [Desulfobulbus alkaliphilus]MBM9538435.1 SDR family oxidoreductase [Desulfobulbus alkaliphilus]